MKHEKRMVVSLLVVCLVITAICGLVVLDLRAVKPSGCYYCKWNNDYQKYECSLYSGAGFEGCFVRGTLCEPIGTCGLN